MIAFLYWFAAALCFLAMGIQFTRWKKLEVCLWSAATLTLWVLVSRLEKENKSKW